MTGSGNLGVSGRPPDNGLTAQTIEDWSPQGFWAVITSHAAGNAYGFARLDDGDPATFPELDGAAEVGDGTLLAAYEVTGRTNVPTDGTVKVWLEPLRTAPGLAFFYPVGIGGGGGTTGNCVGDGWRVGLTGDDEWALRVVGQAGYVYIEPGATVEINGVTYTISSNYSTPSLSLTSSLPSAAPIVGVLDCTACPCFRFAFKRSDFFPDEDVPHNVCARILYVTVCQYCPPGWYCAKMRGSGDLFEPLEFLEGEACRDIWEIRSGPHESEAVARSHCGSTVGCGPAPEGAANVFELDLRGLVTPSTCTPGCMCEQWNRVWQFVIPFPGDCFWQSLPQDGVPECNCSPLLSGNFFARIHLGESPFFGLGRYNRLFINLGTATWTYYGSVAGWDARSPYTFYLASGPGVAGAPDLYCNMPATITVNPV